jgi:hypothetical protein
MSDDRPPAPAYRPPITIPSGEFLGRIAYHAWFEADLSRPAVDWTELSETERDTWRRVARYTLYICCRRDPHPADHGTDDEGHRWVPVEP